ncbi:T9SS type A sorting domain-containing protein [Flavobacterium sp. AG291]|uniref:T9SS type A sorting domain-containing protein n=1 Tax=Flavobacterium sp. AG291 TaxID=2184000 RepID=UPI000E0C04F8|nr:T9SS type A sorting domain-containing protein [Flavobacterium sp. AG291]RDI05758.1 putative secreted protein (Por secretion system target) [Flavobacterium sp. AG291]
MKKKITIMLILTMSALANAQLQNADFEQWQNDPSDPNFPNKPNGWIITDGFSEAAYCMYPPATDTQSGDYALTLGIWYHYVKDAAKQTVPIDYRPSALKGYYKYTDNIIQGNSGPVNDVAQVNIYLTKWNVVLSQNDTIGKGTINLNESIDYSSFTCPVTYTSNETPDNVSVYLDCTRIKRAGETENLIRMEGSGSYFTVDNITLEQSTAGLEDFAVNNIEIYPNPARDKVTISNFTGQAELYDITGKLVISKSLTEDKTITTEQLQRGIYTIRLTDKTNTSYSKLIKD